MTMVAAAAAAGAGRVVDADEARLEQLLASAEGQAREYKQLMEQSEAEGRRLRPELDHRRAVKAKTAAASWHATGGSLLTGDGITEDTLLAILRFLPSARDLLCLQLTNTRFSIKCIAAHSGIAAGGAPAAAPEMLSLVGGGGAAVGGGV